MTVCSITWLAVAVGLPWGWLAFSPTATSGAAGAGAFLMAIGGTLAGFWTFASPLAYRLHLRDWLKLFRTQAVFLATVGGAALLLAYQVMDYDVVRTAADPNAAWLGQEATGAGLVGLFQLVAGATIPFLNARIACEDAAA